MAEVAELILLPIEEADGEGEDHHPEYLDPAPWRFSASGLRRAADPDLVAPDLSLSESLSRRRIHSDLLQSEQDSEPGSEYPEDHVSLDLDLFDRWPPHPQGLVDPFPESPHFSVLEVAEEMPPEDLGFGLGFGSGSVFESQEDGDAADREVVFSDWGADEFFVGRRRSVSESIEFSRARPIDNEGMRIVGFESDSDSDEQIIAIGTDSDGGGGLDRIADDAGLPMCWDCLRMEDDRRDMNEEFEWEEVEEVDGPLEEREALSMMVLADEDASNVLRELNRGDVEPEENDARNIEWEVLLTVNNLERNPLDPEDVESYFVDDHDGFVYTSEYEVLFGQFADHDSSLKGGPPAAKLVIENLPSVVLTEDDVAKNNTLCAVCKDEISMEERAKQLPCSHHYHKECILPWLGIRNTCPLCRFELPTDDPEYEKWKARRAGNGISVEESQVRYDFEILPEA